MIEPHRNRLGYTPAFLWPWVGLSRYWKWMGGFLVQPNFKHFCLFVKVFPIPVSASHLRKAWSKNWTSLFQINFGKTVLLEHKIVLSVPNIGLLRRIPVTIVFVMFHMVFFGGIVFAGFQNSMSCRSSCIVIWPYLAVQIRLDYFHPIKDKP